MPTLQDNFVPEIWAAELNFALRKSLVGLNLVNQDYEGEITAAGDTVHITRPLGITVGTYTPGSDISVGLPSSSQLDLSIDQFKYFAFELDDVWKVQSNISLLAPYMEESGYALADTVDQHLLSMYTYAASANQMTTVTLTNSNIWDKLVEMKRLLSVANVPSMGRWVAFSPNEIALLEDASEFQRASTMGDEVSRNGFMGRAAGFDIYETNNLTEANSRRNIFFGHRIATTHALQFTELRADRRELRFSDLVKGLMLYGTKVTKTSAIGWLPAIVV